MVILLSVVLKEVLSFKTGSVLANLGTNMISMFIVFGALYWVGMCRLIRGQILSIRENDYVLAAKSIGAEMISRSSPGTLSVKAAQGFSGSSG